MPNRKFKILVVDDTPKNIQVVGSILQNQSYQVAFATNGKKALNAIAQNCYDLILLDVMMPQLNGYDTCRALKKLPNGEHVPVIFLTAKNDEASIIAGFDCGGIDYVTKPFSQRELLARVETHLKLKSYEDDLETKVKTLTKEIEDTQREVVFTMGAIGETRSKETGNHVKRVATYSYILAIEYGLSQKQAKLLQEASPMHDIGKVGIPDAILNKAGKLDPDEWEIMKTHASLGYEMLKCSERPILKAAATLALSHHERFDGSGYPQGLKGQDIQIYGRITAICDVFDALGSARCYKEAWLDEDVFALIERERGKHFDPELVDLLFANMDKILEIRDQLTDV
ncbi:MAG: two-component system response regulator [Algicola sp.]|nr:two-component system response regulator [Algicola sp.]